MPAPISLDLRLRIVDAVESGGSISPPAAIKLMQRLRTTSNAAPARYGGHRRPRLEPYEADPKRLVEATSLHHAGRAPGGAAAPLRHPRQADDPQHPPPARSSAKKALRAPSRDSPDVANKRRLWRARQRFMATARFIFLDETATATDMARRYGRSPCGARLAAAVIGST